MMRKSKLVLAVLAVTMAACTGLTSCGTDVASSGSDPKESGSASQPAEFSAPVVTATPAEIEITQGTPEEEYNLLYGVSVTDEYDTGLTATIESDDNFDVDVIGEYTITYKATNSKGKSGTATRKVKVVQPPASLVLQAEKALDTKWTGGTELKFAHDLFYSLTENKTYETYMKGVFYNSTESTIVLDIPGGGGEAAIVDEHGTVIEGRDGANGYLMNAENPQRVGSTVKNFTYNGAEYSVATATFRYMQIPAKGYAVVVTTGMMGEGFDYDGRSFINKNVIYQYGVSVRLYWEDKPTEYLTNYVDKGPTVTPPSKITLAQGTSLADAKASVLAGITITDDNGTFDPADDIKTGFTPAIVSDGGYNADTEGTYAFTLEVSDAKGNKTTFTRTVEVAGNVTDVTIGDKTISVKDIVIRQNTALAEADYKAVDLVIYTKEYTGEIVDDKYGQAFVVNESTGAIVRIYDGANAKYYDAENDKGSQPTELGLTQSNYISKAFASLTEGETLVIAPRYSLNNNATYTFFLGNRNIGEVMTIGNYMFGSKIITAGAASTTLKVVRDTKVTWTDNMLAVYTFGYTGGFNANGYGEAIVLDTAGKIVRVYDGANGRYRDADNKDGIVDATKCTSAGYLNEGFASLREGETLLVVPNAAPNVARGWATSNLRTIGAQVTISGVVLNDRTVTAGTVSKSFKIMIDTKVAWEDNMIAVYTFGYEGGFNANGYGEAIVLDATGKIVRVYDGANGRYRDADHTEGITDETKCTSAGYLTQAFDSLQEGETLLVIPNSGTNAARKWAIDNLRDVGKQVTIA